MVRAKALTAAAILVTFQLMFTFHAMALDGHHLHGAGTVNQSLGGAATGGNTDDVAGVINFNPACAAEFTERWNIFTGIEWFIPDRTLSSRVDANALGAGTPATTLEGSTRSRINSAIMPTIAAVHRPGDGKMSFHFAVIPVAGVGVEYKESKNMRNPILSPQQSRGGMGFGKIASQYEFIRMPLGLSCRLNKQWNAGFSVVPSVSRFKLQPACFAAPDDADGDGTGTYPDAERIDMALGISLQGGLQYKINPKISLGLSLTSPTWFNDFEYESGNEIRQKRHLTFDLDTPMIVSFGATFKPTEKTRVLADMRWLNYEGTDGIDEGGFAPDGSVRGFGWDDQWVFCLGVQQKLNDKLAIRLGYNYCTNSLPKKQTFYNVACPIINQHHLAVGASYKLTDKASLEVGYYHVLSETQSSPWYNGSNNPIAGTEVESEIHVDSLSIGISWHF